MKKLKAIFAILLFATIIYSCNNSTVEGVVVSDEEKAKFQAQIETFKTLNGHKKNKMVNLQRVIFFMNFDHTLK